MYHGCINIYKEKGFTSFDVVAKLRKILGEKKIGHTGTLDPQAEGVLPVCVGNGTKLCDMLTDKDKIYRAELVLGTETDTQDLTGMVLSQTDMLPNAETVRSAIKSFIGPYAQVPPMYSAIKIGGKKLYELAREGKTVERKARQVEIFSIEILDEAPPVFTIRVHCSKGTYIRTLCHDIGKMLGCGGCMGKLLREKAGRFCLEDAITLDTVARLAEEGKLESVMIPTDKLLSDYPALTVQARWDGLVHNGNSLLAEQAGLMQPSGRFRVYDSAERFVGIYQWNEEKHCLKPEKMFFGQENG